MLDSETGVRLFLSPFPQPTEHICSQCPVLGFPVPKRYGQTGQSPQRCWSDWSISYTGNKERWEFNLKERRLSEIKTWEKDQISQSQTLPSVCLRSRCHGHPLNHRRFPMNIRKHLDTMRATKPWHRLPRRRGVSLLRIISFLHPWRYSKPVWT